MMQLSFLNFTILALAVLVKGGAGQYMVDVVSDLDTIESTSTVTIPRVPPLAVFNEVISATSSALSVSTSATISKKRGLAYQNASVLSTFLAPSNKFSWCYNWGQTTYTVPSSLGYVPMLWGLGSVSDWSSNVKIAIASNATHLLSFNEPDIPSQSNIDPIAAASAYMEFMQPLADQVKLGAPAVSNGGWPMGLAWLTKFLNECSSCTIDFICIHWYSDGDLVAFKAYVQEAYEVGHGRPLWITEFMASGDDTHQQAFLQEALPWLDSVDIVERYAYFMAADGFLLTSENTLSETGVTFAAA